MIFAPYNGRRMETSQSSIVIARAWAGGSNVLTRLLRIVAPAACAVVALGQTPAMITLHVETSGGAAVQNADVTIRPAHPVHFSIPGQADPRPSIFATRTDAAGQAQASRADLQKSFPSSTRLVLTVRAAGYEMYSHALEVADSKPVEIVLHPLPAQK